MDIRQQLRLAGIRASTLEARELVCFAAGKTRQQLLRDGQLYVPPVVEEQVRSLVQRTSFRISDLNSSTRYSLM